MQTEKIIFNNLINNEEYGRAVLPFLKEEYFHNPADAVIFNIIDDYVQKYNAFPTSEAVQIELKNKNGLHEAVYQEASETVKEIPRNSTEKLDWLVDTSEKFCQDKAIFNALRESIKIVDENSNDLSRGSIPHLMTEALAVSFDVAIGHDYLEDAKSRFEYYHRREERVPFDIELLNKITKGGLPKKSLTVILASTGGGKSALMCHAAANNLAQGKNVLYITLEMAEERIGQRIDANQLDVTIDELGCLSWESFNKKISRIREKTPGKLIIKEYPPSCAGSNNFRHCINELRIKKKFIPDIIYVDYLGICASSRIKMNNNNNSYTVLKAVAEELRSLAVEFDVPLVTAGQFTRGGNGNSDAELTDIADSFGISHTADLIFCLISNEELDEQNKVLVKQLKNRYNDLNYYKKFFVGLDKSKMKFYNLENHEDDKPVFDSTPSGFEGSNKPKIDRSLFDGFR